MNEPRKRGRPKKHYDDEVKINVRVDRLLWEAVNDPRCSQSLTVTRALRKCLNDGRQDNIASIKISLREARKEIAHGNAELERRRDGAGDAGDYVAQSLYNEAISLLKNDVGMDGV